jgi:hypothetical protein
MQAAYGHGMNCSPTKASTARARRWTKLMDAIETMNVQTEAAQPDAPEPQAALPQKI